MQNGVKHSKIPHTTPFCAGVSKNVTSRLFFFNFSYLIYFYFFLCFLDFRVNRSFYKKVHSW